MALSYPDLDYVQVSIGVLQDIEGKVLNASVEFEPQFNRAVHVASKSVIYGTKITKSLSSGAITQSLLASDTGGLSVTNFDWIITLRVTAGLSGKASELATFAQRVRLPKAAPVVDLDILQPVPQPTVPDLVLPVVTSIAGLTGPVTVEQLAAKGVGSGGSGGIPVGSDNWLTSWAAIPDALIRATALTRNADGALTGAGVIWPDGTTGTYAGTASTTVPGAVDTYTITYAPSGGTTKTVTQPTVTRDNTGAVTNRPAMTVA